MSRHGRPGFRVGFDARFVTRRYPGVARYSRELLRALLQAKQPDAAGLEIVLLVDRASESALRAQPLSDRLEWLATVGPRDPRDQVLTPARLRAVRPDVLFSPFFLGPTLALPCPRVTVLHDLGPIHHPQTVRARFWRPLLPHLIRRAVRASGALVVPSRATARDVGSWLGSRAPTVEVIYDAPSPAFSPRREEEIEETCSRLGVQRPYVLSVGAQRPHKQVSRLVTTWRQLWREGSTAVRGRQLVLAGAPASEATALRPDPASSERFLGWVDDEDLPALYSGADLFVSPSSFEGFGLTVVEAMACGAPVLCSNAGSLPEVTAGAAQLFEAGSDAALRQSLERLLDDPQRRLQMRRAGIERAGDFSWQRAARETLAVLRGVAEAARR